MWVDVDYSKLEQLDEIKDKLPGDTWVIRKTHIDNASPHRDWHPHPVDKIIGCCTDVNPITAKYPREIAQTMIDRISPSLLKALVDAITDTQYPSHLHVRVLLAKEPY